LSDYTQETTGLEQDFRNERATIYKRRETIAKQVFPHLKSKDDSLEIITFNEDLDFVQWKPLVTWRGLNLLRLT